MFHSRRSFLGSIATTLAAPGLFLPAAWSSEDSSASVFDNAIAATTRAREALARAPSDPIAAAADSALWRDVQQAWAVDRSILNLENGGLHPSPAVVNQAYVKYWNCGHEAPSYTNSRVLWPKVETVRIRLANAFGCNAEEMAITRNSTEGFLAVALGTELARGDEILTTTQDYHRFRNAFRQREQRDGVVLREIQLPIPLEHSTVVVERLAGAITPRTRVILLSQVFHLTGQVMPIRDVVRMARARGILVIVDGAHGFAHVPSRRDDLECDVYVTSLHKWLSAPHGTGFLYVRKELIPSIWPLQPPTAIPADNIRKFEAIGSASAAPYLAVGDALDFWEMIGAERKTARLVWLRERSLAQLADLPGVTLNTNRSPGMAGAIVNFDIEGLPPAKLAAWLWDRHRVLVAGVEQPEIRGLRIVPALFTTEAELDRFSELILHARKHGLT